MNSSAILLILYAGLTHAFEADHLLAVSNIVSQRKKTNHALKDVIYWGLGHSSTILLIGVLMLIFKLVISEETFAYFEAGVGAMLIVVAIYRLRKFFKEKDIVVHQHRHEHAGENATPHLHLPLEKGQGNLHKTSYGIGLVHGLAGSGELVAIAMTQFKTPLSGVLYLLMFSLACIAGMTMAATVFNIPFSKKVFGSKTLRMLLVLISSGLCLFYGCYLIYEELIVV